MNYQETLDFLYRQLPMYQRIGKFAFKKDLSNTIALCRTVNNPQNKYPCIHIAGTNGKGSVAHMLAAVLQQSGYKTGLYTSPHLSNFRERIKVNAVPIGKQEVVDFVEQIQSAMHNTEASFFEFTVAMAFKHFADKKVDIAVIETGLGGRLDSTNVIEPVLSIITNISLDHTQMLGNTPEEIAIEKAGIIKQGIPVLIGETDESVMQVFTDQAAARKAPVCFADQCFKIKSIHQEIDTITLIINDLKNNEDQKFNIRSGAPYLAKNVLTTLGTIALLKDSGFDLRPSVYLQAIENFRKITGFRGRWEVLNTVPLLIADGSHNPAGLAITLDAFNKLPAKRKHFVLGVVNDKDLSGFTAHFPAGASYYFAAASIPRALPAADLQNAFEQAGLPGRVYKSVSEALQEALKNADPLDAIYAGGSMFTVAEVLEHYPIV